MRVFDLNNSSMKLMNDIINSYTRFTKFCDMLKEQSPIIQEVIVVLAKDGWYFDADMSYPTFCEIKKYIDDGDMNAVDNYLIQYFELKVDAINNFFIREHPDRAKIISMAFQAYRNESYELAIPVLLSQADGICYEITEHFIFCYKNVSGYINGIYNDLNYASLAPFSKNIYKESPIMQNFKPEKAKDTPDAPDYNRHKILHGMSFDYGTKINSLKTISLLNYVAKILINCKVDKT